MAEFIKTKIAFKSELKGRGRLYHSEFIDLNSPLVVAATCHNLKVMRKEKMVHDEA